MQWKFAAFISFMKESVLESQKLMSFRVKCLNKPQNKKPCEDAG